MSADWFKDRLRELRTQASLSRQELADKAGLKQSVVRDLEQGVNKPTWPTVVALCQALGVLCDAFLEEPGQPVPPAVGRPRKTPQAGAEPAAATATGKAGKNGNAAMGKPGASKGKRKTKRGK